MSVLNRPSDILTKTPASDAIVRNAWYVAAWSHELAPGALLGRRIANEAIVLYRTSGGGVTALADRCPHRRFPLSAGRLDGDVLECGYHGFRFGTDGTCLGVPGQTSVPAAANVRAYPLEERDGVIWVFPGDPPAADTAKIPASPWLVEWGSRMGHETIKARASLLIDNLLDLSHETYIHSKGIGSPEVAETPIAVERDGEVLHVRRKMYGVECPPNYRKSTGLESPIDRFQEIEFFPPSFYVLHVRVAAAGDEGHGFHSKVIYGITPETARTSHLFYAIAREGDPSDKPVSGQHNTVAEDAAALEALEAHIVANEDELTEVSIGIDRGALIGRRMIADLVRAEV